VLCLVAATLVAAEPLQRSFRVAPSVPVDDAFLRMLMTKPGMPKELRANFTKEAVEAYFDMGAKFKSGNEAAATTPSDPNMKAAAVGAGEGGKIDPAVIAAIGKHLWEMVKNNKATVDTQSDYGGVIPEGATWQTMSSWQERVWADPIPQMKYVWHNSFGNQVVFNWYWTWNYNGAYQDVGHYVTLATALPSLLEVSWGYDVKAKVLVSNPLNYGTTKNIVAGVSLQLQIDVSNWRGGVERVVHIATLKGDGSGTTL